MPPGGHPRGEQGAVTPQAEFEWWYQYYFATERGRIGYEKYRRDFNKLIWQLASPQEALAAFAQAITDVDRY